jgi:hypothetical protein
MSSSIVDDWKYRNTPITKKDADKLFILRYYLGVQLKFFRKLDIGKLPVVRYLDDVRQIQSVLAKNGVVDSSMKNEVNMVLKIIDTTIEVLKARFGIE